MVQLKLHSCRSDIPNSPSFSKISSQGKAKWYVGAADEVSPNEIQQSMIVNINPYDTGLDENLRVMEFASLAREVTIRAAAHQRRRTFKLSLPGIHEIRETLVEIVEGESDVFRRICLLTKSKMRQKKMSMVPR